MSVARSIPCKLHNVHYCFCLWTKEQLSKAGVAMDAAPRMTLPTVAMDSATVAKDALTDDEKSLIAMAIRSVQRPSRPTVRRKSVAQDEQLRYFTVNDPGATLTSPLKYKPYKYQDGE
jgi:hypothetical protein